jgi:hypothetical protein
MKNWKCTAAVSFMLAACSWNSGTQLKSSQIAETPIIATSADLRVIMARPKPPALSGSAQQPASTADAWADPNYNVCTEPSPDVAKALSDALTANANATASGLSQLASGASASLGAGFAITQNASLSEIGRRIATTQLLRDGVFRLCEAYANGAISRYEYALVLSRYGDTMITLLAIEALSGISSAQAAAVASSVAVAPSIASDAQPNKQQQGADKGGGKGGAQQGASSPVAASAAHAAAVLPAASAFMQRIGFDATAGMKRVAVAEAPAADAHAPPAPAPLPKGKKDAKNVKPNPQAAKPAAASAASAPDANPPKAQTDPVADAVVQLQKNYLDSSKFAPLIALCTAVLTNPAAIPAAAQSAPPAPSQPGQAGDPAKPGPVAAAQKPDPASPAAQPVSLQQACGTLMTNIVNKLLEPPATQAANPKPAAGR